MTDKLKVFSVYHRLMHYHTDGENVNIIPAFEKVAVVKACTLDEVFEKTNHIDHQWWNNEGVTCRIRSRSTSVGDIIVEHNGMAYSVESVGFMPIA